MMAHSDRQHALLSPSGAHRWLACTPSARLEAQFPDSTSEYAAEGTLAHELCELKLRSYVEATPKRTQTMALNKLKKKELWSDEMVGHAETYLDFIKETALAMQDKPHIVIEKRVDITQWVPEGSGIADCILIGGGILHIIDFKYGKGVPVSAEANEQLRLYALGAYAAYSLIYPIKTVRHSIVQPRISSEVSTWECTIEDELAFGEYVKERAALADKGDGDFAPSADVCRFCRAKATCRARAEQNVKLAFEEKDGIPVTSHKPELLTPDEVGIYLAYGADVAKWVSELESYALSECLAGREIAGWKAVEGRSSRVWSDQEEAFKAIVANGTPEAMLYETTPLSLAKVEKLVGKKNFEAVAGEYVVKQPGKPTLVSSDDKRPAITNKVTAEEAFKA